MSGDFYTLSFSDFRWYLTLCTRTVFDESRCGDASPDDFLTCVKRFKWVGARFNSGMSESDRACKQRLAEMYFGALGYGYVITYANKAFQKICDMQNQRVSKTFYVINPRTKLLPT